MGASKLKRNSEDFPKLRTELEIDMLTEGIVQTTQFD